MPQPQERYGALIVPFGMQRQVKAAYVKSKDGFYTNNGLLNEQTGVITSTNVGQDQS